MTTREVCIKGPNGKMYCLSSPIRDCGCIPKKDYVDPFPPLPATIDEAAVAADLMEVLKRGAKAGDPEWTERLRMVLVTARLVLLPDINIMEPFVIMTLDAPIRVPASSAE